MKEQDIEIWFEREVDSLDRLYLNSNMSESEYESTMEGLKTTLEQLYQQAGLLV